MQACWPPGREAAGGGMGAQLSEKGHNQMPVLAGARDRASQGPSFTDGFMDPVFHSPLHGAGMMGERKLGYVQGPPHPQLECPEQTARRKSQLPAPGCAVR